MKGLQLRTTLQCGGVERKRGNYENSAAGKVQQRNAPGPAYTAKAPGELDELLTGHCQTQRQQEGCHVVCSGRSQQCVGSGVRSYGTTKSTGK